MTVSAPPTHPGSGEMEYEREQYARKAKGKVEGAKTCGKEAKRSGRTLGASAK